VVHADSERRRALLSTFPTKTGTWYALQVSTEFWSTLINNAKGNNADTLNI